MASRTNFPNRVEARRASAKTRAEAYSKLTHEQKIKKATPGSREYLRLTLRASQK